MRIWFLLALLLIAAVVTVRALRRPDQPQWHGGSRWPWITWLLILTLGAPTAWFEWRWQHTERTANEVVQWLADRPESSVACQRAGATMLFAGTQSGFVAWQQGAARGSGAEAWLSFETCRDLRDYLYGSKTDVPLEQVVAVHVLAHEAMHVSGIRNEADAECAAMERDADVAVRLGASPVQAETLAARYVAEVWPRLPDAYRGDCAAG